MKRIFVCLLVCISVLTGFARDIIPLHVEGRYFKDPAGNVVNLHGFGQTYSPWFNEQGTKWNNYDVNACLKYNQGLIDDIMAADWKMDFVRLHMDPYWSNTPGESTTGENDIHAFDFSRFKKYLAEVFIPMAKYAEGKGLYVVMRPPGVCPKNIQIGDDYQQYLLKVWDYVSQQPELKDNPAIMFELANEPVDFTTTEGKSEDEEMTEYMQAIVDIIRKNCNNIVLVPGLGYQSSYAGFAKYPIKGNNVGFAVHCYPGWYNGAHDNSKEVVIDYQRFRSGWRAQIGPVSAIAPIMVTEMDWAPVKYNASWGKSTTGTPGGTGFGANFKKITDDDGNVSWMIFTGPEILAKYNNVPASEDNTTILNDPEACVWPAWHWFQDYAKTYYPSNEPYVQTLVNPYEVIDDSYYFPLTNDDFNPSVWETGTFDENTGNLHTGKWGFGGWEYPTGIDLSNYKYIVAELNGVQDCGASFRIFDESSYWSTPAMFDFENKTKLIIDLQKMVKNGTTTKCDPSHVYRIGFWTTGGGTVSIKKVFLSNDGVNDAAGIVEINEQITCNDNIYNMKGQSLGHISNLNKLPRGIYIINGKKIITGNMGR